MNGYEFTKEEFKLARMYFRASPNLDIKKLLALVKKNNPDSRWDVLYGLVTDLEAEPVPTERQARIKRLSGKYSGEVYYYFWGRDCDLCEADFARKFDNEFEAEEYIDDFYANAEGSSSHYRMTEQEYIDFEPEFRDRAAEMMGY